MSNAILCTIIEHGWANYMQQHGKKVFSTKHNIDESGQSQNYNKWLCSFKLKNYSKELLSLSNFKEK